MKWRPLLSTVYSLIFPLPLPSLGENKDREGELNFVMYRKKHRAKDYGHDDSGFDLNATRTLFVGNLDKQITHGDLRKIFEKFGEVVVGLQYFIVTYTEARAMLNRELRALLYTLKLEQYCTQSSEHCYIH